MRDAQQWKAALRAALTRALRARQADAVAVLRETLAALDNAEAATEVVRREARERRDAAAPCASLGRREEAERLGRQHAVLDALLR